MAIKAPNWGRDIGYQDKIKPHNPNIAKSAYGLKGEKSEGKLSVNREMTRKIARKDAVDGIPVSEAATLDQWSEREQQIASEAEDVRRGLMGWFSASSASVRDFIQDCTPVPIDAKILCESIKAEEDIGVRAFEFDDDEEARSHYDASNEELKAFKEKHRAQIGKRNPDIKKNVEQTIAILLFVMILEGGFNALLFKDAQSSGLLGGMLVAFGISAVNVAAGVLAGFWGLRYLNHPSLPWKIVGGVVATVVILFGLFLNFFVAHFRDAVEIALHTRIEEGSLANFSMFEISPGEVISGMFPNIFGLENMVAYGLLFIGLAIFGIAVYEGYDRISDRYPGYGRVWRKEREAYEKRQEVRSSRRDDLASHYTSARSWFDGQLNLHTEAKREIEKSVNWLELRLEEAQSLAAKVGDEERKLIAAYRQEHRRERNQQREILGEQSACPIYFDDIVTVNMPDFVYDRERRQANEAIDLIASNMNALVESRKWLEEYIQYMQNQLREKEAQVDAKAQLDQRQANAENSATHRGAPPQAQQSQARRSQQQPRNSQTV